MDEPLSDALGAVRGFVAGREPLNDTLQVIAEAARRAIRADMAGVTLVHPDEQARTAACTSPVVAEVDQAQYDAGRGPCLEAYRTQAVVKVDDVRVDERFPEFAASALEHGLHSSLSVPLIAQGAGIGAINLYTTDAGHFCVEDVEHAEEYAGQAAVALANAQAYWEQASLAQNLAKALESRSIIDQAKGVIIATSGVDADAAFDLLRQQSQAENRKLRELAAEIVERHVRRQPRPPTG